MIEIVMYVALGFLLASLVALLLAPPLWRRAVRLTTRRLQATMPLSIGDIQADKDQMRAEFAVQLRRVEVALAKAKDSAARNLIERSKGEARLEQTATEMAALRSTLNERSSELGVLEQTVKRRFPELEAQIEHANQVVAARESELARLSNAFTNQGEALAVAKDVALQRQNEIEQLRLALEGEHGTLSSLKLHRAQAASEEAQALLEENQRLAAELSRLREEITTLRDVAGSENDLLKLEMRRLADQILRGGGHKAAAPPVVEAPAEAEAEAEAPEAPAEEPEEVKGRGRRWRRRKAAASGAAKQPAGSLSQRLASLVTSEG